MELKDDRARRGIQDLGQVGTGFSLCLVPVNTQRQSLGPGVILVSFCLHPVDVSYLTNAHTVPGPAFTALRTSVPGSSLKSQAVFVPEFLFFPLTNLPAPWGAPFPLPRLKGVP